MSYSLSSLCRTRLDKLVVLRCCGKLKTYHKVYFILILGWIIWLINPSNSATSVLHGLSYASAIRGGLWWEKIHRSVLFIVLWRSCGLVFCCLWEKGVMRSPHLYCISIAWPRTRKRETGAPFPALPLCQCGHLTPYCHRFPTEK